MEFILIKRIVYLTEIYELLLNIYMRESGLRLYKYKIHYLLKRIY